MTAHGTHSRYSMGCRCRPCVDANSVYMRDYRLRRKNAGTPVHACHANGSARGRLDRWVHNGRLEALCWCQDAILPVPVIWVRRGLTFSCGRDNCTYHAAKQAA
jgi:hypothetical protein